MSDCARLPALNYVFLGRVQSSSCNSHLLCRPLSKGERPILTLTRPKSSRSNAQSARFGRCRRRDSVIPRERGARSTLRLRTPRSASPTASPSSRPRTEPRVSAAKRPRASHARSRPRASRSRTLRQHPAAWIRTVLNGLRPAMWRDGFAISSLLAFFRRSLQKPCT
ncbi:hypothetical protein PsYK624_105240 [Phanerochaete sordida]|uniref:Uncharacterized protein n=1 Tax=Phanerochaete sordida TaxID=48140 RepID=A0A9P3GG82_9APHY|nr:hypothetical protein PsYK624_105240 [Phanerochaete sordida]